MAHTIEKSDMYSTRAKLLLEMYFSYRKTGNHVIPIENIKGNEHESATFLIDRLRVNRWIYPNAIKLDEITGCSLSDNALNVIESCDMDPIKLRDYMVRSNGKIVSLDQ